MYCMWTCVSCVVRTNGAKYMHAYVRQISKYLFIYLFTYFFPRIIFCTYIIINKYIYIYNVYCFAGYQVILAEYFPAPHLDRSAPGQSRTSSPALHTKTSDQTQMPWRQVVNVPSLSLSVSLSLSLSLCIRIYIYIYVCMYIYCASMQKYCKYTGMCGGM